MSSLHLSPDWLQPPPQSVPQPTATLVGHISETVARIAQDGHLCRAVVDIRDAKDQFWKAELSLYTSPPDISPFHPVRDHSPRPYSCGLELTFEDEFPFPVFQQLQSTFPDADIHVPPLIIRDGQCHPPGLDDNMEAGVFFPGQ